MATPLTIVCRPLTIPSPPPMINIPNFGVLQAAYDTIDKIPDPMDLILKLQDLLVVAMAPVRRYLEMVESFAAIKECFSAIPEAILTLSPDPILDCFKALTTALARVLSWLPPMCYVKTGMDIAGYCIDMLDAVFDLFTMLDRKIAALVELDQLATNLGDLELAGMVGCGMQSITISINQLMPLLKFVMPINNVLMEMFTRLLKLGPLKKAAKEYTESAQHIGKISDTMGEIANGNWTGAGLPDSQGEYAPPVSDRNPIIPFPPLTPLIGALGIMRNTMVLIYNCLAPLVGEEPNKQGRAIPSYSYL
jgi:hypothetical protein